MTACAVCDATEAAPLYKGLVKCGRCGFIWASGNYSSQELEVIYQNNYFFGGEYKDYIAEEAPLTKDFRRLFSTLSRFKRGGRYLEIGSAYGFSLNLARSWFDRVEGVEINPEAAAYAVKRFNVETHVGDFLAQNLPEKSYDAVTSWATLEHLPTPHLYIEKVAKLLKPGGVFACTTIDIEALVPRFRKDKWRQIHPPTHVSYYSKRTLSMLLKKYGFKVRYTSYRGQHRSFDNVFYGILVLIYGKPRVYEWLKRHGLTRGTFYLNLFDTVFMIAEKE